MARRKVSEEFDKQEEKRPLNKKNLSKLLGIFEFVLPYKGKFIGGLVLLIVSSFLLLTFPFLTGKLIDIAAGRSDWVINSIDQIALLLGGILFLQGILSYFRVYLFSVVSEKSMADVRYHLYQNMIGLPMSFFDKRRTGELISRITTDVSMLQNAFSVTLAEFVRQVATLVIGTTVIFFTAPRLSWFMLAVLPIVIIMGMVFGRFIRKLSRRTQDELAKTNVIIEETIQAIHAVKAFTSELFEVKRYRGAMDKVVKVALYAAKFKGAFISFIIFILFGTVVAVMWYGARLVQLEIMTVGDLMSFVLYSTFIGGSIAGLGDIFAQIQRSIGASERVLEILNKKGEIDIHKPPMPMQLLGRISFQNVSFSYPTRKSVEVLKGINLEIQPGQKVALVGHSGAGKSTFIQLLMRFYDVQAGDIKVDGKSISTFNLLDYRRHIGIVPQEVILFGGTIRENIAYGKLDATDIEIRDAAAKANALEFIESFPEGFDTLVGERGVKLSGGQRQRIAIARAILKNPAILILDEATSSLDAGSERLVQDALDLLMKNRTTIIIAHRLATIRKVDHIYVFGQGSIIESGTHEKLLLQDGNYSNLIRLQMELQ
jgi:ABC transporter fused permease/ATP-binding protein